MLTLWGFGRLFPFSELFDNPGQSLIQSAEDLLSWFRIGRYLQCPPRKEPQDIRFATSPTRPSYTQLRTFRQGRASCREDGVNCIERPVDQIHNFSVWRAVQRESLNRSDNTGEQAGKIREDGEWKMRPPPSAREEGTVNNSQQGRKKCIKKKTCKLLAKDLQSLKRETTRNLLASSGTIFHNCNLPEISTRTRSQDLKVFGKVRKAETSSLVNGLLHPKMKMLSLITYLHIVPNM